MSEYRVLLVEDNAVNALMVRTMLERVENPRFAVSHADSLVKALDVLAHGGFDAALVDLNLPDSAGLETFLAIQRNAAGLAIDGHNPEGPAKPVLTELTKVGLAGLLISKTMNLLLVKLSR